MKKRIDLDAAKAVLIAVLANYELKYQVACAMHDVLADFDGRPYSKRMAAAVQKKLSQRLRVKPGDRTWQVKWGKNSSSYYLLIHGNGINLKDRLTQLVGHHGPVRDVNLRFDYEFYRTVHALPYLQLGEPIKHMQEILKHLPIMAAEWNKAAAHLESIEETFGYAGQYILPARLLNETMNT